MVTEHLEVMFGLNVRSELIRNVVVIFINHDMAWNHLLELELIVLIVIELLLPHMHFHRNIELDQITTIKSIKSNLMVAIFAGKNLYIDIIVMKKDRLMLMTSLICKV